MTTITTRPTSEADDDYDCESDAYRLEQSHTDNTSEVDSVSETGDEDMDYTEDETSDGIGDSGYARQQPLQGELSSTHHCAESREIQYR